MKKSSANGQQLEIILLSFLTSIGEETSLETDLEDSDILAKHEELADAAVDNERDSTTDDSIEENLKQDGMNDYQLIKY